MKTPDQTDNPLLNELDNQNQRITELQVLENEHKQTESGLRESEDRLKIILESVRTGIVIIDSETHRIVDANPFVSQLIGAPQERIIGSICHKYICPAEEGRCPITDLRQTVDNAERVLLTAGGRSCPVIKTVEPVMLGGRKHLLESFVDITERKATEEALQISEELARQMAQETALIAKIGRIISSTLSIEEVYKLFSEEVKKLLPFDRIVINMIDTEKGLVKNVYVSGERVPDRTAGGIYLLKGSGNAEMVRTKSAVLIQTEDFDEYKDRLPELMSTFQAGFRSIMNVPLFSKGKIIGGLLLRSRKPYAYTDKDLRIAERIGNQIAGAIANAQLYLELAAGEATVAAEKKKAEELEALNQQLRASEQQLRTSEQQLKAANQQLEAKEQALQESQTQLMEKLAEVERFNKMMVGRELTMIKLKEEIKSLLEEMGKPKKY